MVKLKRRYALLTFIFSLCLGAAKMSLAQDSIKVYADPESITGFKASRFIEKIDFLPLQTTKQSKYLTASQFMMAGDAIVIRDNQNHILYLFDKSSGKFLYAFKNDKKRYVIDNIQYVPSKNALLIKSLNKHYTITDKKNTELVHKWQGRDISRFVSLQWLFLGDHYRRQSAPVPSIALNNDLFYYDDGFIYRNYGNDKHSKDSVLYRLVQYDSHNRIKHQYFPFFNLPGLWSDYYRYRLQLSGNASLDNKNLLFQLDFSPAIYELTPDTITEKYQFVFPMSSVMPQDFNQLSFRNNIDYQKYKDKNEQAFSDYYGLIEHGNYLFFNANTLANRNRHFMLTKNILYDINKVTTDSSIYNLPPRILPRIFGQDQRYVYSIIDIPTIIKLKESLLKDKTISKDFKDYLSVMTKDDNDIILKIQLK